jgi:predicted transcriptional regulator
MLPDLEEISSKRRRLDLTQSRFAKKAGVSRSLLAKIERGYANPSYMQAKKIFDTMERLEEARTKKSRLWEAGQIHSPGVIFAEYNEPIRSAQRKMKDEAFSQLPVRKDDRIIGSITERGINARIFEKEPREIGNLLVRDFLEEGFPQFSTKTPVNLIIPVLQMHQAVLTVTEGKVAGIITNTDILKLLGQ